MSTRKKSTIDANLQDLQTRWRAGHFDTQRAETGYDNITLMVHVGDLAGEAFMMASGYAQNVVSGDYATGNMTYAHENGHNFGLCHNYGDTNCSMAAVCSPTGCGYGESKFRTVMSYPGGPRTRQWSAPPPAVWYVDGVSAVGQTGKTDATACLKKTLPYVAAYHDTVIAVVPPDPVAHTAPTALTWTPSSTPPPPPPPPPTHSAPSDLLWTPESAPHSAPTGLIWTVTQQ